MGRSGQEVALRALGAALDVHAPMARHGVRTFPEGTPFLWLTVPGAGGAIVFLDDRHWICLSEPGRGGVAVQLVAGGVDDDPALVVSRLMVVMTPVPRPAGGRLSRALKVGLLGLAGGAGMGVLAALLMAVLVAGNGYTSDTTIRVVYVLAALIGVATGLWVSLRWWRMDREPRDRDSDGQGP
ncbi:hypothetical protein [Streptosporangium sp. NBC_01469]|uniref:hypothetical protein n=1 Tax=Streptosporangium sp. NBC_01469 TaxID=2903898 RepID=UPI002E28557B|nr:hypothetical protein [Streptosporangium sp. NBC_01469]